MPGQLRGRGLQHDVVPDELRRNGARHDLLGVVIDREGQLRGQPVRPEGIAAAEGVVAVERVSVILQIVRIEQLQIEAQKALAGQVTLKPPVGPKVSVSSCCPV